MGIVVMWLPLTASSRPLSGLRSTEVVLWSSTVSKALVVSAFGGVVTIIAGAYRTVRMRVSDDTKARIVRCASPEVVSSCVEVPSSFAGTPSSFAKVPSSFAGTPSSFAKVPSSFAGICSRRGGVLPRLAGTMAVALSRGLDVNGMCSAVRGMGSAMRGMMLVVLEMCSAVRGMGSAVRGMGLAACLADWGKQKKQFRRTASYGWQMGLEPTTFRTTI